MRLRLRVAVAAFAVTVPMVIGLLWLDARARHRAADALLPKVVLYELNASGERARCETAPATWGAPEQWKIPSGPPLPKVPGGAMPVYYAFDSSLMSQNPRAPQLSDDVISALSEQDIVTVPTAWWREDIDVVVKTPWGTGSCAYVYAHGTTVRGWIGSFLPASEIWLAPLVGVLIATLLAVGPVSRRIATREARERALRDFLANTTHDVVIPLTVLQAHLAALRDGFDAAVLTSAMDEAHYIGALVGNLAIAARLDAGQPNLLRSNVDLGALVGRVIGRHRPIARQRQIALEHAVPETSLTTDADVTFLEQAVSNVVYNAIRHNCVGGHVAVILEPRGDRFQLRVFDDGGGIPADELARVVERGYRTGDARTRAPDGQGVGLDIAWRVARLHGFELRFAPSEHGGLEVTLEGPRSS